MRNTAADSWSFGATRVNSEAFCLCCLPSIKSPLTTTESMANLAALRFISCQHSHRYFWPGFCGFSEPSLLTKSGGNMPYMDPFLTSPTTRMFLVPVSTGATLTLVRTLRAASTKPVIQLCGQHEPFWAKHGKGGEQADRLRPGSRACAFGTESCAVSGRGRRWRCPCPHAWLRGRSALSSCRCPTSPPHVHMGISGTASAWSGGTLISSRNLCAHSLFSPGAFKYGSYIS